MYTCIHEQYVLTITCIAEHNDLHPDLGMSRVVQRTTEEDNQ